MPKKPSVKTLNPNTRKTVSINKAVNGFTVNVSISNSKGWNEKTYIAKNEKEARKIIAKNL